MYYENIFLLFGILEAKVWRCQIPQPLNNIVVSQVGRSKTAGEREEALKEGRGPQTGELPYSQLISGRDPRPSFAPVKYHFNFLPILL